VEGVHGLESACLPVPKGKEPTLHARSKDTFLTILYVIVDDLCQPHASQQRRPGPPASLSESEVIALAIFARWSRFSSERDFYRYAEAHLRAAFPTLPDRSQFNRLVRFYAEDIEEIAVKLGVMLEDEAHPNPRHSIVRRCLSGTPSAGVTAGSPGKPTSVGPTA
jgi:hypothetical protein